MLAHCSRLTVRAIAALGDSSDSNAVGFRLTVRAIAALGDSADSNVVIVHAESDDEEGTHQSPPRDDDDGGDDPDKGPGKEPGHCHTTIFSDCK